MSLAIRWNDFYFFFQYQQAKNRAREPKMDPKIDTFDQVDIRDLAILGSAYFFGRENQINPHEKFSNFGRANELRP